MIYEAPPETITVGSWVTTPSDVRALKVRVNPYVWALDRTVLDCRTLDGATRLGWQAFSSAWRTYYDGDDSWLHASAQLDQGRTFEHDLQRWQDMIAGLSCTLPTPRLEDPPPPAPDDHGGEQN